MPPRKSTTKKVDPTPEENEMAEEENIIFEEAEDTSRNPLEIEVSLFPEMDPEKDAAKKLFMTRIAECVLEIEKCDSIVLKNTLDEKGITYYGDTSEDEGIVTIRTKRDEARSEIAEIYKRLEKLEEEEEQLQTEIYNLAQGKMREGIDEYARKGATDERRTFVTKYTSYRDPLKWEIGDINATENAAYAEWLSGIHKRVYPNSVGAPSSGSTNTRTAHSRDRSAEIRTWARNNGIKVNDKGRISQHVISRWEAATGNDMS